ncbi:MAG: hypothetical protein Kow0068_25440 [Marinilabiliales bacterium]
MSLKSIINDLFKAMNSGDFSNADNFLDDNISFDFPGTEKVVGKKRVVLFLKVLLRKYPGLTFQVNDLIIDNENQKACAVWTNHAKTLDNNEYNNSGITLCHIKDGKISYLSDYFKVTSFIKD